MKGGSGRRPSTCTASDLEAGLAGRNPFRETVELAEALAVGNELSRSGIVCLGCG